MRLHNSIDDFLLRVAAGLVPGYRAVVLNGHNPDIDGPEEDLWEQGGTLVYLNSAERINFASTSGNDTSAGSGLRTMLVNGIDGSYNPISETITLNGVSNVLSTNSYLRVFNMEGLTAGASRKNEGFVTATAQTAGTVQCAMAIGHSLSQNSHYTVPAGEEGFIVKLELNASKTVGGGNPLLDVKYYNREVGVSPDAPWVQVFDKRLDTAVLDDLEITLPVVRQIKSKSDIRLAATTDTLNTELRSRSYILLKERP